MAYAFLYLNFFSLQGHTCYIQKNVLPKLYIPQVKKNLHHDM